MGTKEILNAFGKIEEAYFDAENKKRGKGRPRKQEPTKAISFRIETDLLEWLQANKGKKSINQFINDIIRDRLGL